MTKAKTNTSDLRRSINETIEFEIKRIEAYEIQAGWNTWILVGALATITGFLFSQLEKGLVDVHSTTFLFIGWSLIYDWFKMIISEATRTNQEPSKIYPAKEIFSFARVGQIFILFRSIMLVWAIYKLAMISTLWVPLFFYGVFALGTAINFIYGYSDTPHITNHRTTTTRIIVFLFIVSIPYQIYTMATIIASNNADYALESFKISGLIAIIIAIGIILAERQIRRRIIGKLEDFYINLNLGVIDEFTTQKLLKNMLTGMSPFDYLEKDASELEKVISEGNSLKIRKVTLSYVRKLLTLERASIEFKSDAKILTDRLRTILDGIPGNIKGEVENIWYKANMEYLGQKLGRGESSN